MTILRVRRSSAVAVLFLKLLSACGNSADSEVVLKPTQTNVVSY